MNWIEKLKLRYAKHLDKNESYCWATLSSWVFGFKPLLSIFFDRDDYKEQICRPENVDTPYAYCGKCEKYYKDSK